MGMGDLFYFKKQRVCSCIHTLLPPSFVGIISVAIGAVNGDREVAVVGLG
jgi:hypothetical protein